MKTSRDRVIDSINHKEPDRVPIDLGSSASTGISAIAYSNLKKYLEIKSGNIRIHDMMQQLACPEDEILDSFHIDLLDIGSMFNINDEDWYNIQLWNGDVAQYPVWFKPKRTEKGDWIVNNSAGDEMAIMVPGMPFFDQSYYPYIDGYPSDYKKLFEDMQKIPWGTLSVIPWNMASKTDFWKNLRENTIQLRAKSDRALVFNSGCRLFEQGAFMRRMDYFLMDLLINQKEVEKFLDALMELHLKKLEMICNAVGDIVDIIRFSDDLGMESNALMSKEDYINLFKPRHKILCDYVKKNSSMHTCLHSCGSIYELLPDLIEAGFEIINPVQTSCYNMEPERLKKKFGRDITFLGGGCEPGTVLKTAKPKEVKSHVKKRLEIFIKNGGFIFATIHNILSDVPPENIIALFEAIDEFYQSK